MASSGPQRAMGEMATTTTTVRRFECHTPNHKVGCQCRVKAAPKQSAALRGNKFWLGRKHSAETKAKMSSWQIGRVMPAETRAKISASHKTSERAAAHRASLYHGSTRLERALYERLLRVFPSDMLVTEYRVGPYRADIAVPDLMVMFEADGPAHLLPGRPEKDAERDHWLAERGWEVIRFSEGELDES